MSLITAKCQATGCPCMVRRVPTEMTANGTQLYTWQHIPINGSIPRHIPVPPQHLKDSRR